MDNNWNALSETLAPDEVRVRIKSEVEVFLKSHPEETPEVLVIAYWGYRCIKDVPESLFEKMLQYPKTRASLVALIRLAELSDNPREKWEYYRRIINEFTFDECPDYGTHQDMLRLAAEDRSLTSDTELDTLIEGFLQICLAYLRKTQQNVQLAYTEAVQWRIKFGVNLDKALETLEYAEAHLKGKEYQQWLIERNKGSALCPD